MEPLYKMTPQARSLYEMFLEEEIDHQTFQDTLESMSAEERLEACVKTLRQCENDIEKCIAEKKWINDVEERYKKAQKRAKDQIVQFMTAIGQKKARAGMFDLTLSVSKSAQIVNDELVDKQYLIPQQPKINKDAIRKDLLAGKTIEGAVLVENTGVRIR